MRKGSRFDSAFRIAAVYALFAAIWIVFSGYVLEISIDSVALKQRLEMLKGLAFVSLTAIFLYFLLNAQSATILEPTVKVSTGKGIVLVIVGLLLLTPLLGISIVRLYQPTIERRATAELEYIAKSALEHTGSWQSERFKNLESITHNRGFQERVAGLRASDGVEFQSALIEDLTAVKVGYDYEAVFLLDADGGELLSVGDGTSGVSDNSRAVLKTLSSAAGGVPRSTLFIDPNSNIRIASISPVLAPDADKVNGFLLLRSDPGSGVFQPYSMLPGTFQTLESMFVHIDKDKDVAAAIYFSESEGEQFQLGFISLARDHVLKRITKSQRSAGSLSGPDHHGHRVLAWFEPTGYEGWTLLVQVRQQEAFGPIKSLAGWVSGVAFFISVILSLLLFVLWRQQRRNYQLSLLASSAQSELLLQKQEKTYRELYQNNPQPMWVFEKSGNILLSLNEAAVSFFGYARQELEGESVLALVAEEDAGQANEYLDRFARKKTPQSEDIWRVRKKNGEIRRVFMASRDLMFAGREAVLATAYDLTERLQLEQELSDSMQFVTDVLDNLSLYVTVLNECGDIIAMNKNFREFTASFDDSVTNIYVGANYLDVCRRYARFNEGLDAFLPGLEQVISGERDEFQVEYRTHFRSKPMWFAAYFARLVTDRNKIVISHRDITSRKQAELEIARLNRYYGAMKQANSAMIRSVAEDEILAHVCDIAARNTDLVIVSISHVRNGEVVLDGPVYGPSKNRRVEFVEKMGAGVPIDRLGEISEPFRVAVQENRNYVSNRLADEMYDADWLRLAGQYGLKAQMCCPVRRQGRVWGLINFYAGEENYFIPDLIALLEDLVSDLNYSFEMLERENLRKEAEAKLLFNAKIIESTRDGLMITDKNNYIRLANVAICEMTGRDKEELLGSPVSVLRSGNQTEGFFQGISQALDENDFWEGEVWHRRKNGEAFPVWLTVTRVWEEGSDDYNHIVIYRDISERKAHEKSMEHAATHDLLTDLPNRVLLEDRLSQAIASAERSDSQLAVLFIDLDKFKLINDTLGHEVGDAVLRETASRISGITRSTDTVSRIGSDEFIAVLVEISSETDAGVVARKIVERIAQPFKIGARTLTVTASVGISIYPNNARDVGSLMRLADIAKGSAKQSGQNCFQYYSAEMEANTGQYFQILNELRQAIKRHQLFMVFQPQCMFNKIEVVGIEALVRWQHPHLGLVTPEHFIPIAEDSGLIIEMGAWILRESCHQAKEWLDRGVIGCPISVNVSALQFRQRNFVNTVEKALNDSGLPPGLLELEMTESLLMVDSVQVRKKLVELHRLGVKVAIDDFGTGYSSLSYLHEFPANKLKIDRSFVSDLPDNPDAVAIAKAIIALGSTLGMDIIAEGIETEQQAALLNELNCNLGQGYLYARPMPREDFEIWLKARRSD